MFVKIAHDPRELWRGSPATWQIVPQLPTAGREHRGPHKAGASWEPASPSPSHTELGLPQGWLVMDG